MVKQLFTYSNYYIKSKHPIDSNMVLVYFFLELASILHYANLDLAIKSYLFRHAAKENVLVFITLKYV